MTITIKLTFKLFMWLTEKKMLGLSRSQDMVTGEDKYREEIILDSTAGEAEAVRAMNGASIIALSPPSCWNDFLKLSPLLNTWKSCFTWCIGIWHLY